MSAINNTPAEVKQPGPTIAPKKVQAAAVNQRIARAVVKASAGSVWPLCHGRCCLGFLLLLVAIRLFAWHLGNIPGGTIWFVHVFSLVSDIITSTTTLPLLICGSCGGVQGQCVQLGCVGPMLTMVVAMNLVDACSLLAFFAYAAPRPLPSRGKSFVELLQLVHPVWELVLIASCALNFAVGVSCWRIYRELRVAGLYPPNSKGETPREDVSPFEVLCEAEDVALLSECTRTRQDEVSRFCTSDGSGQIDIIVDGSSNVSSRADTARSSPP